MTTTPRLGMTELAEGQAIPETSVNEIGRWLEQGANMFAVLDILNAAPGSPTDGQAYLVGTSPTGAWASYANRIAFRMSTGWIYIEPMEGMYADVADEDALYRYSGSAWGAYSASVSNETIDDRVAALLIEGAGIDLTYNDGANTLTLDITGSVLSEASDSEMWTGTSSTKTVTPKKIFDAAAPVALTDGSTITIDGNTGINFSVTLGGNRTLANPTNMKAGQSGIIAVTQDGTGSRTLSYGSNWKFPGGAAAGGVLSTGAGKIDAIAYLVRSGGTILATLTKDFS